MRPLCPILFFLFLCLPKAHSEEMRIPAAIHIHSNFSNGKYSIEQIAALAKFYNIKVLVITDSALRKWRYGLPPFRNVIRKTVQENSILKFGAKRYLKEIRRANEIYPEAIIIPGAEVSAFYYWTGNALKGDLTIHDWHKHMLLIGLKRPADYNALPLVSNGFYQLNRKSRFDQYHGEKGILPYQDLIDHANNGGMLAFWAHPEASFVDKIGTVKIKTQPHEDDILNSKDYTGFAVFYEGYEVIAQPGGQWDKALKEYCEGKRQNPVWAIGELDYLGEGINDIWLNSVQTVLILEELSETAILSSIRKGKMYAVCKPREESELKLDEFVVEDTTSGTKATMGDTAHIHGKARIKSKVSFANRASKPVKIKLIKGGQLIKLYELMTPADISFEDDSFERNGKSYYRLEVYRNWNSVLISNPIFVKK